MRFFLATLFSSPLALILGSLGGATLSLCPSLSQAAGEPNASGEEPTLLDAVVISGHSSSPQDQETTQSYRVLRSRSATKTDTDLRDIPQSISAIPIKVLEDLNVHRVEKALDFAGGASRQNDFGGLTMYEYSIRGLTTSEFYRDGFSVNRGYMNTPDTANIERVDVLKGPASSLYGRGDPGGTVNLVSKKPKAERFTRINLSAGRWDQYRSALDFNTPLDDEAKMLFRLNASAEDKQSFRNYRSGERQLFAPSFSWELRPNTRLLVQSEIVRNRQTFDRGVIAPGGHLSHVSRSAFFGEPNDGKISNNNETLQAELEHDLNQDWTLRLASHYKQGRMQGYSTEASSLSADYQTLNREQRHRDYEWQDAITQLELRGTLHTGGIEHTLLFGTEVERYAKEERMLRSRPTHTLSVYEPIYGTPHPTFSTGPTGRSTHTNELVYSRAFNFQDQLKLTERLQALVGARYEHYEHRLNNQVKSTRAKQTQEEVTPRVGLLYQLTPELGVFANASRSFKPNTGMDKNGGTFEPEKGRGYETGIKLDLFDHRLSMTLAAFHIIKRNVLTTDPTDTSYQMTAGKVRSKGMDFQFSGQITDDWRIIGAYAYISAEIREDNTLEKGTRLLNIPQNSGSLMAIYTLPDGPWRGLELGGHVNYVGRRSGNTVDTFELPSYTTLDLISRIPVTQQINLGLNFNNLFDKRFYERSYSNLWVMPGEPRNLSISLALNL
ncbi:iron complex outermembrane receptor protein [Azomonas agilis]|uniref:Metal-pseudopaline receptor CntO n=1 Tax=Azomonas agilis TaxID=116849 RepID=A0A562J0H3_9GAMM|nr:TonB-dependent siderophore receptor [Azomonas agilis]TWH76623.1 iron complex outermembrane receptor protein [Azomonas agilis]